MIQISGFCFHTQERRTKKAEILFPKVPLPENYVDFYLQLNPHQ